MTRVVCFLISDALLSIELRIVPIDTHAEWQPPITRQVLLETMLGLDAWMKRFEKRRVVFLPRLEFPRKRKFQPTQHLPHGRIRETQLIPYQIPSPALVFVTREQALKVA